MTGSSKYQVRRSKAKQAIIRIATVAVLAVALGFFVQGPIIVLRLLGNGAMPEARAWAELAQTVSWSLVICTGVAIGVSIGKARAALAGLIGVLFTPLALAAAKASEKVVLAVIDALEKPMLLPIETVGVVRAAEYGLLAFLLTMLTERKVMRARPYLLAGVGTGTVFGGGLSALHITAVDVPMTLVAAGVVLIREIGSPIGCALVIYAGQMVALNFKLLDRGGALRKSKALPPDAVPTA